MTKRHFTLEELSAWLDGEVELDGRQQAHLKECAECSGVLEGQRRLRRLARRTSPEVPTARMWREIESQLSGAAQHARRVHGASPLRTLWHWLGAHRIPAAGVVGALGTIVVIVLGRPWAPLPRYDGVLAAAPARTAHPAPPAEPPRPVTPTDEPAAPATTESAAPAAAEPKVASEAVVAQAEQAPRRESKRKAASRPSEAPAAASRAPAMAFPESAEDAAPRETWRGRIVTVTANRVLRPEPNRLVFAGEVVVAPVSSTSPWVATVDGLTRTLTGRAEASAAEILLPAETLRLTR